ncbi:hypothetical protein VTJ83DRAFT_1287 [Remersonia thermophila]|uniref:Uncharacterized protein n=1 Tax=Remersonia thermophila TaxID=72144 RepID=A0ABR4DNY7_9PEZI
MMEGSPPSTGSGTSGPKLIRPIPRRPFNLGGLSSPTPPDDSDDCASPRPQISASDLRFLARHQRAAATPGADSEGGSTPLNHTTSYLNLTSGTLFGIYSPSTLGSFKNGDDEDGEYDAGTPGDFPGTLRYRYGLGGDDDAAEEEEEDGEEGEEDDYFGAAATATQASTLARPVRRRELVSQLALRAALLFALGVGYGALVTRLPTRGSHRLHHLAGSASAGAIPSEPHAADWRYLVFWGAAGVALGSLLPWFDRFWEDRISKGPSAASPASAGGPFPASNPSLSTAANPTSMTARRRRLTSPTPPPPAPPLPPPPTPPPEPMRP